MAGDWIKMRKDLPDDPAVYKLANITKLDRLSVVGRLYAFWAWADKHAVDGVVDGATSHVVDDIALLDGFADALVAVKWLKVSDNCISIPHHERHNGESAKERGLKNQRQTRWREKKAAVDAPPSTTPSTREEKRREDIKPARGKNGKHLEPIPEGFVHFWNAWPSHSRKADKENCLRHWNAHELEPRAEEIIGKVTLWKASPAWTKDAGEFIPAPLTWLHKKNYDAPAPSNRQPVTAEAQQQWFKNAV